MPNVFSDVIFWASKNKKTEPREEDELSTVSGILFLSDDTVINFCLNLSYINLFYTNWRDINSSVDLKYKIIKIYYVI